MKLRYKPKNVLILLASFNGKAFIEQQLVSLIAQEGVNVDILISDDCSSDGSQTLLKQFDKVHENIQLICRERSSGSAGANFQFLFRTCDPLKYDYVCLSDQDDIWHSDKLIKGIKLIEKLNADGYSSSVTAFWPTGRKVQLHQSASIRQHDYLFEGAGQGCTFILRSSLFFRVQKFCKAHEQISKDFYYHDWLIYLLARCWGQKWVFDENSSMLYRQHDFNDTGSRSGLRSKLARLTAISNGWYKGQVQCAIRLAKAASKYTTEYEKLEVLINHKGGFMPRVLLARYIFRYGRRKLSDRIVLTMSAMLAWL